MRVVSHHLHFGIRKQLRQRDLVGCGDTAETAAQEVAALVLASALMAAARARAGGDDPLSKRQETNW